MFVIFVFCASGMLAFRMLYGAWPPTQGSMWPWLASDERARWALLASMAIAFVCSALARSLFRRPGRRPYSDPEINAIMNRGREYHARGEMQPAIECFEQARSLCGGLNHPDAAAVYAAIAKAHFDLNDFARAEENLGLAQRASAMQGGAPELDDYVRKLSDIINERRRVFTEPQTYRDSVFRFSMRIPSGWMRQSLEPAFANGGGRISISHQSYAATLNVSAGILDRPEWQFPEVRASSAEDFLKRMPGRTSKIEISTKTQFAGEPNAIVAECDTSNIVGGKPRSRKAGFISVYHKGTEYVIQWSAEPDLQSETRDIIQSFTLVK